MSPFPTKFDRETEPLFIEYPKEMRAILAKEFPVFLVIKPVKRTEYVRKRLHAFLKSIQEEFKKVGVSYERPVVYRDLEEGLISIRERKPANNSMIELKDEIEHIAWESFCHGCKLLAECEKNGKREACKREVGKNVSKI